MSKHNLTRLTIEKRQIRMMQPTPERLAEEVKDRETIARDGLRFNPELLQYHRRTAGATIPDAADIVGIKAGEWVEYEKPGAVIDIESAAYLARAVGAGLAMLYGPLAAEELFFLGKAKTMPEAEKLANAIADADKAERRAKP